MRGIKHKNPMQTRHGRIRYKAYSIEQLREMLQKATNAKAKYKIGNALNFKVNNAPQA